MLILYMELNSNTNLGVHQCLFMFLLTPIIWFIISSLTGNHVIISSISLLCSFLRGFRFLLSHASS